MHGARPGARCAADRNGIAAEGRALAEGARRSSLQHLRAGIVRKLDASRLADLGLPFDQLCRFGTAFAIPAADRALTSKTSARLEVAHGSLTIGSADAETGILRLPPA